MLIAIWGRDGTGKSTLCDALGQLFARRGVTVVLDTDLTQPTLPSRVTGVRLDAGTSLGKAISGIGTGDAAKYLHRHQKQKALFYAGLTDKDDYLSYELGLESSDTAQEFVERCAELADTVILDLSSQRNDPFLPCALSHAEKIIVTITADMQGVCWFSATEPFLEAMNAGKRVLPVSSMADRQPVDAVEKALNLQFAAELPYVREFRQMRDAGLSPLNAATPAGIRYAKQVQKLYELLKEVKQS